jgi:diguanylate cyclase (GGDEF)-like protein
MEKIRSQYEKEKIMTLFKQMALAFSIMIITILGSVMAINYKAAKKDMVESLYQTTVNNISTLSDKIAQTGGEPVLVTSVIDSEFDSGYYRYIKFTSNDASFTYKQEDTDPIVGVPLWFVDFANIKLKAVHSDVTSGWDIIGQIVVKADPTIVYKALYQTFTKLLYLFVIFVILSLILLSIMLHFILKPLGRIQHQAESILNNEFVIESKEPYTTEFREVAHAMNAMVKKVEEIFNKANEAAQRNRELLYNDPITKLFNRRYLMLKLPELIQAETKSEGGSIILIALNGADLLNKQLGRKEADSFFYDLAQIFLKRCSEIEEKIIARVNGTEFTLMLSDCELSEAETITHNIFQHFNQLAQNYKIDTQTTYLDVGIYRYHSNITVSTLLTRADNALTKAKADEHKNLYVYEDDTQNALPKEEWRSILENAIEQEEFNLKFWTTVDTQTKEIAHKVMTFAINNKQNQNFFYGDFIAPAINLGLVGKIYLVALKKLFTEKHPELNGSICSVRLSNEFLKDSQVLEELAKLLNLYGKKRNFKLYFEISDSFAIQNSATLKAFVLLFKKYDLNFGINSFTGESPDFHYLKDLNPKFIKADVSFLLDQTKESMNSLEVITKSLGIELIASFVKNETELNALQKFHIYKVQGPITDKI